MITFLKGDTTATITLALAEGFDYSNKTVCLEYQGVQLTFSSPIAGGSLIFCFTAGETASMSLGSFPVRVWLEDENGNVTTIHNADVKMRVTDCIADVHSGGAIYLDVRGGLSGIDGLPERYTDKDVHDKINEILRRLGGTVAALLLCALPVFGASLTLHTAPKGVIYNDQQLVTNATLDVSGLATPEMVTNIVRDVSPTPDFSTNNAALVETIEATAPAPGNYAAVSNAAMNAVQTEIDPVWAAEKSGYATVGDINRLNQAKLEVGDFNQAMEAADGRFTSATNEIESVLRSAMQGVNSIYGWLDENAALPQDNRRALAGKQDNLPYPTNAIPYAAISGKPTLATVATSGSYNDLSNKPTIPTVPTNVSAFNNDAGYLTGYTETDPTISSWAKAASKPTYTADEVGAVSSNKIEEVRQDNAQTRQIVTTWENFLDGSNVVFSITNYLSGSYNLDAAKLRILELRDGEYHEVYNSRDEILLHIDDFSNRYVRVAINAIVDEVAARLVSKADRDWGKYTSAGGEAPSNTVYMTAPNTVFAGGLEYERVAVGEGTICVLTTRGAPVWTQGDEGTFKFQDDGGTNYFGFAKTDSYTIGANTDGITVQGGMVTMNYNITMSGRPCVWYKSSLSSGAWEQLNLPDGSPVAGASHAVTWEANPDPGTQVCYINVGNAPSGFFRATVEVAGEAKFMTNMPADLSGGWICPNTATGVNGAIKPSFNGSSVIWTWSAN